MPDASWGASLLGMIPQQDYVGPGAGLPNFGNHIFSGTTW